MPDVWPKSSNENKLKTKHMCSSDFLAEFVQCLLVCSYKWQHSRFVLDCYDDVLCLFSSVSVSLADLFHGFLMILCSIFTSELLKFLSSYTDASI